MLTRDQLLYQKPKLTTVKIDGGDVLVRRWTGLTRAIFGDQSEIAKDMTKGAKNEHLNAVIVALSVVDNDGVRVFSDEDIEAIKEMDGDNITAIVSASLDINGLAEKSHGEALKNSETDLSEDSTSA